MSAILGTAVTGAGGVAYTIDNSLRFRASANAYLNRTPTVTGNRRTWTLSSWVKRGALDGRYQVVMFAGDNETDTYALAFDTDNTLNVGRFFSGWTWLLKTSAVYRDPSAWYHFVVAVDTTQATASNRVKIYVNGVQVTAFSTANYPAQNFDTEINSSSFSQRLGYQFPANNFALDGYMAEVNFIDGQALTPSSFGATDASTGVWQPKAYSGSYGTNGFYLKFSDIATTSGSNAGLGKDFSGNANYWNTNNISVTSGVTYDAMTDSPTPKSSTVGNYSTFNPLLYASTYGYRTLSNGNLTTVGNSATNNGNDYSTQTIKTGKWYAEFTCSGASGIYPQVGIISVTGAGAGVGQVGYVADSCGYFASGVKKVDGGADTSYGNSFTTNDVIGVAVDADNGAVYFSKNGVFQNSGVPTSGASKTGAADTWTGGSIEFYFSTAVYQSGTGWNANFGQRPFSYTAPTGFVALNTFNLPTPTIGATAATTANKYFDVSLYTGTGANQSVTNSGSMQPDLVWVKSRSNALWHHLVDSVRGVNRDLFSNSTDAEFNYSSGGSITAFNSNGFSLGTQSTEVNGNGFTFVGWQWRANQGTNVTNTAGSITSTVSANTTAGFSIVTYTGNGTNATVGHGLGASPSMIIVKKRSAADPWPIYHITTGVQQYIFLNATDAVYNNLANYWGSTAPSSTVFGLGPGYGGNNSNGSTYVAYCFAPIAGYSAFGSYTGNGSSDGPFIYTGFRPRWVMFKKTNATSNWSILDTARDTFNVADNPLLPNTFGAETTSTSTSGAFADILSNGFKLRGNSGDINDNGATYIYAAFAESPFKYANAR